MTTPSFIIKLNKNGTGNYTISVNGPDNINVDDQPFDPSPIFNQQTTLDALAERYVDPDTIKQLGQTMYDCLFIPLVWQAFKQTEKRHEVIRLCLQIEDIPELSALPWELLHNRYEWLGAISNQPFVRRLVTDKQYSSLEVSGALRILFVGATPRPHPHLDIESSYAALEQALAEKLAAKNIQLDTLIHATKQEVINALHEDYHILYFAGHGSPEAIFLDDGQSEKDGQRVPGEADTLTAIELARLIEGTETRLILLAACNTSRAPAANTGLLQSFAQTLIDYPQSTLPAVIAMQYEVEDDTVSIFAESFFRAVAELRPVDVACANARKVLIEHDVEENKSVEYVSRDVFAPVMYLQAENSTLFKKPRNTPFIIAMIALIIVIFLGGWAFWQSILEAERRTFAEQTAVAESEQRAIAETQQAIEAEQRAIAETQQAVEAEQRAIAETQQAIEAEQRAIAETQQAIEAEQRAIAETQQAVEAKQRAVAEATREMQRKIFFVNEIAHSSELAINNSNLELGVLLAIESIRRVPSSAADSILRRIISTYITPKQIINHDTSLVVNSIVSPDKKWLAIQTNKEIQIHNISKQEQKTVLETNGYNPALFSPNSQWLVRTNNAELVFWNLLSEQETTLPLTDKMLGYDPSNHVFKGSIYSMDFSADNKYLALGGKIQGFAEVWDLTTQQKIAEVEHGGIPIASQYNSLNVDLSADGTMLATTGIDGSVRVWNTNTSSLLFQQNSVPSHLPSLVRFSPNNKLLYFQSFENDMGYLFKTNTWEKLIEAKHSFPSIAYSPDSDKLALKPGPLIEVWDLTNTKKITTISGIMSNVHFDFDSSGNLLAIIDADTGDIRLIEVSAEKELARGQHKTDDFLQGIKNIVFLDKNHLLTSSTQNTIVWEFKFETEDTSGYVPLSDAITFNSTGTWLATGRQSDNKISIQNTTTGRDMQLLTPKYDTVEGLLIFKNNKYIIVVSYSLEQNKSSIEVWDTTLWKKTDEIGLTGIINDIDITSDGIMAISISQITNYSEKNELESSFGIETNSKVPIWNVISGKKTVDIEAQSVAIAFSSNGKWLVTGSHSFGDNIVQVWNIHDNRIISEINFFNPEGGVESLDFHPHKPIVAVGTIRSVYIWNVKQNEVITRLDYDGDVHGLKFSHDGSLLAASGIDSGNPIIVWNSNDWRIVSTIYPQRGVPHFTFSPDDKSIVISTRNTTKSWVISPKRLIEMACSRVTRNLTLEEWTRFFRTEDYQPTCPNLLN